MSGIYNIEHFVMTLELSQLSFRQPFKNLDFCFILSFTAYKQSDL